MISPGGAAGFIIATATTTTTHHHWYKNARRKRHSSTRRRISTVSFSGRMYEKSHMHRDAVSHAISCASATSDFFVSGRGWPRSFGKRARGSTREHFRHTSGDLGMIVPNADALITLGEDGSAKIFDEQLDMIGMIVVHTSKTTTTATTTTRTQRALHARTAIAGCTIENITRPLTVRCDDGN